MQSRRISGTTLTSSPIGLGCHSTSDDPGRYRLSDEVDYWRLMDPIDRLRQLMEKEEWVDATFVADLAGEADELAASVRETCRTLPEIDVADIFGSVLNDAYWMIKQAISHDDPVIFYEPKQCYWVQGEVARGASDRRVLPLDRARLVRTGTDVTVLSYGAMVQVCVEAAAAAEEESGCSLEVIDLRSLAPLGAETITASVRHTGRFVVVHEAPTFLGLGAEIAAQVTERCFYFLESPVGRQGVGKVRVRARPLW